MDIAASPVVMGPPPSYGEPVGAVGDVDLTAAGCLRVTVSIQTLVRLLDPVHGDPWGVGGVTAEDVEAALSEGRLRSANPCWSDEASVELDSTAHAERIAWLIRKGWDGAHPIQLEIDEYGGVALNDGCHRTYALAHLGLDGPVTIELSGFLDIAERMLDVTIL